MKYRIAIFLTIGVFCQLFGTTYTFEGGGDWTEESNWDSYPGLELAMSDTVIIEGSCHYWNGQINNSGTIIVSGGSVGFDIYWLVNDGELIVYGEANFGYIENHGFIVSYGFLNLSSCDGFGSIINYGWLDIYYGYIDNYIYQAGTLSGMGTIKYLINDGNLLPGMYSIGPIYN